MIHDDSAAPLRAFERLYRETRASLYALCLRMTRDRNLALDCLQEAYVRAWRGFEGFEQRAAVSTWLHRIAVNVVLEQRRSAARRPVTMSLVPAAADDAEPRLPSANLVSWDTPLEVREIEQAIAALPEGARDALVLCSLHGYSHGEAAAMLGIAEGTCRAQLHRARTLLRARLDGATTSGEHEHV